MNWVPYAGLLCVAAVTYFVGLGSVGILDLDEGLYAAAARAMHITGDWVTPRVNGVPFFEKPPLIYWQGAAAIAMLGAHEWAVRFPSALEALLNVLLVYAVARRFLGNRAAWLGAVFFALAPVGMAAGRLLTTDSALDLWVTLAVFSYYAATRGDHRVQRWAPLGFWLGSAMATLAKGAPGVVLPLGIAAVHAAMAARFRLAPSLQRLRPIASGPAICLFLAVVAYWHIAAYAASGGAFVDEYLVKQHIGRFRGGDVSHRAPFWFFVPGFIAGMFPWSLLSLPNWVPRRSVAPTATPSEEFRGLLRVWCVFVFVLFSVSGSKLVSYILPMYPAAALLAGDAVAASTRSAHRGRGLVVGGFVMLAVLGTIYAALLWPAPVIRFAQQYSPKPISLRAVPADLLGLAAELACICAASALVFVLFGLARRRLFAFGALVAGMTMFAGAAALHGLPLIDRLYNAPLHEATRRAASATNRSGRLVICTGGARRPSVLFYVPAVLLRSRRVIETASADEAVRSAASFGSGAVVLPATALPNMAELHGWRRAEAPTPWALLVLDPTPVADPVPRPRGLDP